MNNRFDNTFTHLHVHSHGSFLDGLGTPSEIAQKAKDLGMKAIAITDHNALCATLDFQRECKKVGIKPILGLEGYYTENMNILSLDAKKRRELAMEKAKNDNVDFSKCKTKKAENVLLKPYEYDTNQYHILFLAKNQKGWNNLCALQSETSTRCTFNGRFLTDLDTLNKYKEGLICTTACIGSYPSRLIQEEKYDEAEEYILKLKEMFKDDFYLELQPLSLGKQAVTNKFYIGMSKKHDIKLISTNDVHYINKDDNIYHDIFLCIGTNKLVADENRMKYSQDYWIRTREEMIEAYEKQYSNFSLEITNYNNDDLFNDRYEKEYFDIINKSLDETNRVADKIDDDIQIGSKIPLLPKADVDGSSADYFTKISYQGLYKYLKENKELDVKKYEARLNSELNVINTKGYADYILIVKDMIDYCFENKIPCGPGRGSAAGSLALFVNNITKKIDPIKYNLLFFRFLTMDRTSLPDVDVDYSYLNRHRIIEYCKLKYGDDCVSNIGTFTTVGVKSGLRDVGRVLGMDLGEVDAISKKITEITDNDPSISFKMLDKMKDGSTIDKDNYKEFKKLEDKYSELFEIVRFLEGRYRNMGVHASGVLITSEPIAKYFPTRTDKSTGDVCTLYDGPSIESIGGVKFDILGLKTLDVLDLAMKASDPNKTIYDLYDIVGKHIDDKKMFDMLKEKKTEGIFQLESDLFKSLIGDIDPNVIDDIIVITSIGRPGPLKAGLNKMYARRKKGLEEAVEPLPNTWDIVKDSLGVMCYQENAMMIAQKVAGFNDNQSDSFLRKALAKKKKELLELCDQWFIYGKINAPYPEGYDINNHEQPYYDPTCKYGSEIKGGLANGYDLDDMKKYLYMTAEFASYLFNKSHAATYSFISLCTMYCKKHIEKEFWAALLSLQSEQEKIQKYIKCIRQSGIKVTHPDINLSSSLFTPSKNDNSIMYGLSSVKGVGEAKVEEIVANRPYASIEEVLEKVSKKSFNKTAAEALILSGAFDGLYENYTTNNIRNRYMILNDFYALRKVKDDNKKIDAEDIVDYDTASMQKDETELLGESITCIPWWDTIYPNDSVQRTFKIKSIKEQYDKNNKLMAKVQLLADSSVINSIVFSSIYAKNINKFAISGSVTLKGKKDERGNFIVQKIA